MVDSFYTPSSLADRLISYIHKEDIKNVIDFCIGDGDLIRSAKKKWPRIKCFGTDISQHAINKVKIAYPTWQLEECDFLNPILRKNCKLLQTHLNGFDLILLNPPFSCVGGSIYEVNIDNVSFKVSTAMKFLGESLKYLHKDGVLYAILPMSVAFSEKDKKFWYYLQHKYSLSIIEIPNGNFFKKCSPNIIFVSLNDYKNSSKPNEIQKLSLNGIKFSLFRGKLSMDTLIESQDGKFLIHTTNLVNNEISNLKIRVKDVSSFIDGPAVLIPRVGNPNSYKICRIEKGYTCALSDCIIAIKTNSDDDAIKISQKIKDNWATFKTLYIGTGAKYITLNRLLNCLS